MYYGRILLNEATTENNQKIIKLKNANFQMQKKKSAMMFPLSCNIFEQILSNLIPSRLPYNIPFLFQLVLVVTAQDMVVCWGTSIIMILKFFLFVCAAAAAIIVAFTMIVPWMESKVRRKENYIEQGLLLMWIVLFFSSSFWLKIKKTGTKAKLWVKFSSFFPLFVAIVIRLLYFILLSENGEKKMSQNHEKERRARWKGSNKSRQDVSSVISKWQSHWRKSSENIFRVRFIEPFGRRCFHKVNIIYT